MQTLRRARQRGQDQRAPSPAPTRRHLRRHVVVLAAALALGLSSLVTPSSTPPAAAWDSVPGFSSHWAITKWAMVEAATDPTAPAGFSDWLAAYGPIIYPYTGGPIGLGETVHGVTRPSQGGSFPPVDLTSCDSSPDPDTKAPGPAQWAVGNNSGDTHPEYWWQAVVCLYRSGRRSEAAVALGQLIHSIQDQGSLPHAFDKMHSASGGSQLYEQLAALSEYDSSYYQQPDSPLLPGKNVLDVGDHGDRDYASFDIPKHQAAWVPIHLSDGDRSFDPGAPPGYGQPTNLQVPAAKSIRIDVQTSELYATPVIELAALYDTADGVGGYQEKALQLTGLPGAWAHWTINADFAPNGRLWLSYKRSENGYVASTGHVQVYVTRTADVAATTPKPALRHPWEYYDWLREWTQWSAQAPYWRQYFPSLDAAGHLDFTLVWDLAPNAEKAMLSLGWRMSQLVTKWVLEDAYRLLEDPAYTVEEAGGSGYRVALYQDRAYNSDSSSSPEDIRSYSIGCEPYADSTCGSALPREYRGTWVASDNYGRPRPLVGDGLFTACGKDDTVTMKANRLTGPTSTGITSVEARGATVWLYPEEALGGIPQRITADTVDLGAYSDWARSARIVPSTVTDVPTARDDTASAFTAVPATIDVLANDSVTDPGQVSVTTTGARHGTVTLSGKDLVYTPDAGWYGTDDLSYSIVNASGVCDTGTVTVNVRPLDPGGDTDGDGLTNGDEVARDTNPFDADTDHDGLGDADEVARGTNPLALDSDHDGLGDADEVARGTNPLDADTDGDCLTDGEELSRGTNPRLFDANTAPTASPDASATTEEAPVDVPLLANDTDGDGDAVVLESVGEPEHGTASRTPSGTVVYTPAIDFTGTDHLPYTIHDDRGSCSKAATGDLAITVTPAPTTAGQVDTTFGDNGVARAPDGAAVATAPGDKIVTAGAPVVAGIPQWTVARYDAAGHLDPSFGSGGVVTTDVGSLGGHPNAVAVAPDGSVVAAGIAEASGADQEVMAFARYQPDGTPDPGFGSGGVVIVPCQSLPEGGRGCSAADVALQPDGAVVAAGHTASPDESVWLVLRLHPDGSLDGLTEPRVVDEKGFSSEGTAVAVQPDGKILTSGRPQHPGLHPWALRVARFKPDLTPDTSFGTNGLATISADTGAITMFTPGTDGADDLALMPDGRIVVAGKATVNVTETDREARIALARYLPDGRPDPSFGGGDGVQLARFGFEAGVVSRLAVQPDGRILVAGTRTGLPDPAWDFVVRRFAADGIVDPEQVHGVPVEAGFDADFDGGSVSGRWISPGSTASDVLVTPDGAVVASGTGYDQQTGDAFGVLVRYAGGGSTAVAPQVTAEPSDQTVDEGQTVTFAASASGQPAPTVRWQASPDQGATWADVAGATATTLSFTATASDDGRQYRAVFTNGVPPDATTDTATLHVRTAPGKPAKPSATAGNAKATVTWTAPGDGRSTLTGYTVTAYQGGVPIGRTCTATPPTTACEVAGLTNGTAYTFTVEATNQVGTGPESDPSDPVTPTGPPGALLHPLDAPTRILDSRPPPEQVGPYGSPWGPGATREVTVAGAGGVPAGATAVSLNVTVTGTTAPSFLTVWPKGATQPTASNLNWVAGQTIPNAVTVKVGTDGKVNVFNPSGTVDVIVDAVGYYDQSGAGAGFTAQAPKRILDSRPPPEQVGPYSTPWGPGTDREVTVAGGTTGVPADAEAVVVNATVTGTTAESFLTIYPDGAITPTASSLNWKAGGTIPNAVTVKVGNGDKIRVFNSTGNANVILDVVGYFTAGAGDGFHPVDPVRFQDSRPGGEQVGAYGTPWAAGTERTVAVTTAGGVPAGATAVLANVTVTTTTAESFLTVWNTGASKPTASNLNWKAGVTIANSVTAKVGTGDTISMFNNSGMVNVVADVAGWYG